MTNDTKTSEELLQENAELRKRLEKYDGILFNTNLSPQDELENWMVIEDQFGEIVKLRKQLEEAKDKINILVWKAINAASNTQSSDANAEAGKE